MRKLAFAVCVAAGLAATAAPASEAVDSLIQEAKALCNSYENGAFSITDETITETDLTGDGQPETIVDESTFGCSSAASMFCGTGGCMVDVVIEGQVYRRLAKDWKVVEWGPDRLLLLAIHGSECGGNNLRRCYEALVWSEGAFRSARPEDPAR